MDIFILFIRILMGLEAIVCLLLIGIVLLQRSKGQGVGLSFGGGAEAVFGAQMGNVLTRGTVILAVIFLLNTTLLAVLRPKGRSASVAERIEPVAPAAPAAPAAASTAEESAAALELLGNEAPVAPAAEAPASPAVVVPAAPAPAVVVPAAPAVEAPATPAPVAPAAPAAPAVEAPAAPAPVAPAVVVPAAPAPAPTDAN